MTWTTQTPTKPGWYWYQEDSEYPECIEIFEDADGDLHIATTSAVLSFLDDHCAARERECISMQWSSETIAEPEDV